MAAESRPESVPSASAVQTLCQYFARPLDAARTSHGGGARVVGAAAHTVPWEILRAAGCSPVVVRSTRKPAQQCDEFLEPGVFGRRIRSLFESVLAGDLNFLSALVIPRTSEQDYKTYLYLREVEREGRSDLPALWFYDLLCSPSAHAYAYGLMRTRELVARLEAAVGRPVDPNDLEAAVVESNAARAAFRRLLALRQSAPRLAGTEAFALLGAFSLIDRSQYAALANRAADEASRRSPLAGPRVILAGAWCDDVRLHELLESHGAVVVAEEGGWGSRGAGKDIARGADPVGAIFDKYYRDGPSVRQFPPADRAWLHELTASDIDGVVYYLPPDDSVMGWDVPQERAQLETHAIRSLVIRDDLDDPEMPERCHERIAAFVRELKRAH